MVLESESKWNDSIVYGWEYIGNFKKLIFIVAWFGEFLGKVFFFMLLKNGSNSKNNNKVV